MNGFYVAEEVGQQSPKRWVLQVKKRKHDLKKAERKVSIEKIN